jgi:ADP-ribose pyrophosphatase
LDGREVFKGKLITVRVEDGHEIVRHPVGVAIVAVDESDQVLLVRQRRPAVGQSVLEVPAGIRDQGEAGPAAAQRELGEEAGLEAALLERLTEFYTSPGFTDEVLEVYLATGLSANLELHADAGEKIDETVRLPLEEAFRLCSTGEIRDSKTIVGIALARERLRGRQIGA